MSAQKVLIGVIAGVAVGALLGVLFAPDKGAVTRKKIMSKGHDLAEGFKDKYDELSASLTDKFESAKEEAGAAFEKGKNNVKDFRKDHA